MDKEEIKTNYIIKKIIKYTSIYIIGCSLFYWYRSGFSSTLLTSMIEGMNNPSHLWYLYELVKIYFFLPILLAISKNEKLSKYFIIAWLVFCIGFPTIGDCIQISKSLIGENELIDRLFSIVQFFRPAEFCTYSGYLLLGHYLYQYKKRQLPLITLLLLYLMAIIIPSFLNARVTKVTGEIILNIYEYRSLSALVQTICITLICRDYISTIRLNGGAKRTLMKMSNSIFVVYLIHPVLTEHAFQYMVGGKLMITVPILTVIIFAISCFIALLFKKLEGKVMSCARKEC